MIDREKQRLPWFAVVIIAALICAAGLLIGRLIARPQASALQDVTLLPCTSSQTIDVLDKGVVYSDGTSLRALGPGGRQIWSYVIGANCSFSVGGSYVAGWSDDQLVVLNATSGDVLFSANLNDVILSATAGETYTAALIGQERSATLVVLDKNGREIDRVTQSDITVLSFGFFSGGNMLYVMALDTNGTVPMSQITTYRPGRMQAGSITDSEQVIYEAMFESSDVCAVGTTYIRVYDYTGAEQTAKRRLVYGWELIALDQARSGTLMAFVPMAEIGATAHISDVRMILGDTDRTVRMPFECFDITVRGEYVYGFSANYAMIYGVDDTSARAYHLPFTCDGLVGVTSGGRAVLVSGDSVYMVSLPK